MAGTKVERQLRAEGGRRSAGGRSALIAVFALLLVALVGLGSGRPLWDVGGPPRLVSPRAYAGDLIVVAFGLLAVAPLIVTALRGRKRGRRAPDIGAEVPPVRFPWWLRIVAGLVLATVLVLSLLALRLLPGPPETPDPQRVPPLLRPDQLLTPPSRSAPPPVHWWGYAALALVVVAGALVAWRLRRTPERHDAAEDDPGEPDELLAAVDVSLEEIELEPDPRLAVIRAYARMEGALARAGLERAPFETPLEYLARALASLRVGRRSVERLTALFQRAKFSQHEIDGSMKAEALSALTALRDELAGAAA